MLSKLQNFVFCVENGFNSQHGLKPQLTEGRPAGYLEPRPRS